MFQKYPCPPTSTDYTNLTLVYGRHGLDFDAASKKADAFLSRFDVFKNIKLPPDMKFVTWIGKQVRVAPNGLDRHNPGGMARLPYICIPLARVPGWLSTEEYTLVLVTEHGAYRGFEVWHDEDKDALYEARTDLTTLAVFDGIQGLAPTLLGAYRKSPADVFRVYRDFDYGQTHKPSMHHTLINFQHKPDYSKDTDAT